MSSSGLNFLARACYGISKEKGFWESYRALTSPRAKLESTATKLALISSEVSEALEELRIQTPELYTEAFTEEVVDILIRTLDLAGGLKLDIEGTFARKMEKNKNRPVKHGKRF